MPKSSIFVTNFLMKVFFMDFIKAFLVFSSMAVLAACAGSGSNTEPAVAQEPVKTISLNNFVCPDNQSYIRGEGVGNSADEALVLAQRQIANRIQSTVESSSNLKRVQSEDDKGREAVSSSYEVNSLVYSRLENAQAARQVGKVEADGRVGVVACMSIEHAMAPFRNDYIGGSVDVITKGAIFENEKHPLTRLAAFDSAKVSYAKMVAAREVMDMFHYKTYENNTVNVDSIYKNLVEVYRDFRSHYAFYYNAGNGGEGERAIFGRLSQKYHVVAGECQGGVLLAVNATEPDCKDGSFGTTCSSMLTLTGSSCGGESYFVQKTMVKGTGKYGRDEAIGRLVQNIADGEWFTLWTKVLDQWNVK